MSSLIRFAALVLFAFTGAVLAQPVKPTRMLVGFPPGGNVDVLALRTPSIRERMRGLDLEILELSPAQLGALVKRDYERWIPVVKASGFTAED